MYKILLADDDKAIRNAIKLSLSGEDFEFLESSTLSETFFVLQNENVDLVLLDVHFGRNETSIFLLEKMSKLKNEIPVIILSGAASATEAATCIKLGAHDFIEKPISADKLRVTIKRTLEHFALKNSLNNVLKQNSNYDILGNSESINKIKTMISQFADKDIKILITGETGTGKEVVANSIWKNSKRREKPFVVVNCAAIPDNLLESELFGHKKGSFTGAVNDQVGKIEMADTGTLFLDEIGDLSIAAQTKLLRFLETGEIQKLGTNTAKKVDVRVIAATSRDLIQEISKNHFREDLFFRLNVLHIQMPELRNRKSDIPILFEYFVKNYCVKFEEKPKIISFEAVEILQNHSWPGNIRELRNIAEKTVVLSSEKIEEDLIKAILSSNVKNSMHLDNSPKNKDDVMPLKEYRLQIEKKYIEEVLRITKGSVTEAAKLLKTDRAHLHLKITQLGVEREV